MDTRTKCDAAIGEYKGSDRSNDQPQPQPRGRAEKIAGCDQRARKKGQRLPALLIYGHNLRHDVEQ